ncbi:hypothetical protein [Actinoplanes xinjiangensis]|uniref:Uncharacterized protein n=1 Tax=Actinoplanes xinjiangensis TaxID=512350 RepID=A0A316G1D7_9ACTN|nr:hypothetical protein [Actinoplanes xinjiangensis]PWK48177.1 hypothetical protein BC793_106207 [Actinoplanes xinjiangensis]GIF39069.1 hypothetical protein Axi01nite_33800 [Actinoplanes xinjiangensis]
MPSYLALAATAAALLTTLSAPAHSATAPAVLALTPTAVGRIPVGGPAGAAERMLRRTLGPPDRAVDGKGCELDPSAGPRRTLTWGALTVSLAPAGKGRLVGWTIGTGRIPPRVRLPHGVTNTTTVRAAVRTIPGATTRWDEVFQMYWITAPAEPAMVWAGDHEDGSGRIAYITNAFEPCE